MLSLFLSIIVSEKKLGNGLGVFLYGELLKQRCIALYAMQRFVYCCRSEVLQIAQLEKNAFFYLHFVETIALCLYIIIAISLFEICVIKTQNDAYCGMLSKNVISEFTFVN